MMRDTLWDFSNAQSIVINSGADADSTDILDLGTGMTDAFGNSVYHEISKVPCMLVVEVTTAVVGNTAVLTVTLDNNSSAATGGTDIITKAITIGASGVAKGVHLVAQEIPRDDIAARYLTVNYAVGTANITAGAVNTYIIPISQYQSNEATTVS